MPTKTIHGVRKGICTCLLGMEICFLPLEWILNLEDSLHSLQHVKTEVRNCAFFCNVSTANAKYLRLWRPASKFKIHSKGKKQMSIPKEHVHIPCLTPWIDFVGILGFQSMALRYQTPCRYMFHE